MSMPSSPTGGHAPATPDIYQDLRNHYAAPGIMNGAFHLWENPDFIYVNNPKAVCSSTKAGLNKAVSKLTGEPYRLESLDDIHTREIGLLHLPFALPQASVTRLLGDKNATRFTFVRDPLERLISAVFSKLTPIAAKKRPQRKRLFDYLDLPFDHPLSIEDLVEIFRTDKTALYLDKHWQPQHHCIAYGLMPYTVIGNTARWDQDFTAITKHIFGTPAPQIDTRRLYGHETPTTVHKAERTPRLIRLVEEIYAEDYAMLERIEADGLTAEQIFG